MPLVGVDCSHFYHRLNGDQQKQVSAILEEASKAINDLVEKWHAAQQGHEREDGR